MSRSSTSCAAASGAAACPGSACSSPTPRPAARPAERLDAVAGTTDGFELSRVDLDQRREGDVLGASQSGWRSSLQNLRVLRDEQTIVDARAAAVALLEADPDLGQAPALADAVAQLEADARGEFVRTVVTRIVAGRAGGRRLATPRGSATRPTSDRVREAVFSALEARLGGLDGLRVLDLYAGTGALGLEAWSRGADAVTLVEHDRRTAALVARNAREVGCRVADVRTGTVASVLAGPPPAEPFDVVLSDPPYDVPGARVDADLAALADGWLADGAVLVVERSSRTDGPAWPAGYEPGRSRRYGETTLWWASWYRPGTAAAPADGTPHTAPQQE